MSSGLTASYAHRTAGVGRVEMWRGDVRLSMSVPAPFVWRCLSGSTIAPFPHPAHRTGQADFPHPALGQDSRRLSRATPSAASEHHVELIDPMGRRIATIALAEWGCDQSLRRRPCQAYLSAPKRRPLSKLILPPVLSLWNSAAPSG